MPSTLPTLFEAAEGGDSAAAAELFTALYAELHTLARRELARHGGALSVGVTTLLHQAYIDMAERDGARFPDRARFMGYAARVMRGLIVDHARRRQAQKRGGLFEITALPTDVPETLADAGELSRIGAALDSLAASDPELAVLVDLKYFCGFSFEEVAALQGISVRTAKRHWEKARVYLYRSLKTGLVS